MDELSVFKLAAIRNGSPRGVFQSGSLELGARSSMPLKVVHEFSKFFLVCSNDF